MHEIGVRILPFNLCHPSPGRILFVLFLLFFYLLVSGAAEAQEKSFLWQVRSNKSNIYILGSIHFWKRDNYPLRNTIEKAFDGSHKLVFEIDLKNADAA